MKNCIKKRVKRYVSGMLALLICCTSIPVSAVGKNDEKRVAEDIEIEQGNTEFDIETDYSGIEINEEEQISFVSAFNEDGQIFNIDIPDTYMAEYSIVSAEGRSIPVYRNIHIYETESEDEDSNEEPEDNDAATEKEEVEIVEEIQKPAAAIMATSGSTVKVVNDQSVLMNYIYCTDKGRGINNYAKYVADDPSGNQRAAYCVEVSATFGGGSFAKKEWKSNRMYSEIAQCIKLGVSYYQKKGSSGYTTGNWRRDYYATQTAIYSILADYGYDGMAKSKFKATSGYEDCYNLFVKLYDAAKKHGASNSDGYEEPVSFSVKSSNNKMYTETINGVKYYRTGEYTISSTGDINTCEFSFSNAPTGIERVKTNNSHTSPFYIRIKAGDVNKLNKEKIDFSFSFKVTFKRNSSAIYSPLVAGQNVTFTETSTPNDPKYASGNVTLVPEKAKIKVEKVDSDTNVGLQGAVYGIYKDAQYNTLVTKITTDSTGVGTAEFVKTQDKYYVKEISAPDKYYRNFTGQNCTVICGETSGLKFRNDRVTAEINLQKYDKTNGNAKPLGDGSLQGAVYGLYARTDIASPDKSKTIYKAGDKVTQLVTDKNSKASVSNLYLGKYYLKEEIPSEGYQLDPTIYEIDCTYEGDLVKNIVRNVTSYEEINRQPVQFIKVSLDGSTDAPLLEGAGFSAYLVSSLSVDKNGNYEFDKAEKVILTADGKKEIFTDSRGYALTRPLEYGLYIFRETTVPENHIAVDDFYVRINEHNEEPQVWKVLLDKQFEAKLKIIKKDSETNKAVLLPNTEFKIFDIEKNEYVKMVTTYPTVQEHESYFTSKAGYLILPQNLKPGRYRIEEKTAPDGYVLNKNYFEINITSNTAYQIDPVSGDVIIEVDYKNEPAKGELHITKKGEVLRDYVRTGFFQRFLGNDTYNFVYEVDGLENAEFKIYADENIYTPDFQLDGDGIRILLHKKGDLIRTVKTDKTGKAVVSGLYLGRYRVEEVKAPDGFLLQDEIQKVTFVYVDGETPVIVESVEFLNERQKVDISIIKKDAETEKVLQGAIFGLYAAEEIKSGDKVLVKEDELMETSKSDKNGVAKFEKDLPLGNYYIVEITPPDGYLQSDEIVLVDATYQGQDIETVVIKKEFKNIPTTTEFTKLDITTRNEICGAELSVTDSKGKTIDSWISGTEPHIIKGLHFGENYTLTESFAPLGYLKAESVEFSIDESGITTVIMEDDVPTGSIIVNKSGEFLDSVTAFDKFAGWISYMFNYVKGNLQNVEFEVYAAEDIYYADKSGLHFEKDDFVGRIVTNDMGIGKLEELPIGSYVVKEVKTNDGFVLDLEDRTVHLSYVDMHTEIVYAEEDWENIRQKVKITVVKKDEETEEELKGALFALHAGEEIKNTYGEVLLNKDDIVEYAESNDEGIASFEADIPLATYYISEVKAPEGYVTSDDKIEVNANYAGDDVSVLELEYEYENIETTVEVDKWDLHDKEKYVLGAELAVFNSTGEEVDNWIADAESHTIRGLVVGETYTLKEIAAPYGYQKAADVEFTVNNIRDAQNVFMQDDRTEGKIILHKTDTNTGENLEGVEFSLEDSEGNILEVLKTNKEGIAESGTYDIATYENGMYKEELKYYLKETKALDGYKTDGTVHEIIFEYEDDETQVVEYELNVENEKIPEPEAPKPEVPRTGDNTRVLTSVLLGLLSLVLLVWGHKKRQKNKIQ